MASVATVGRKVPELTAYFWVVKVLSTAQGEATSDYVVHRIDPVIAALLGAVGLAISLVLQLRLRRYVAWSYWLAVVMVAIFGTMAADAMHIKFGVPYAASSAIWAVALIVVFVAWFKSEGTLSIHSITTLRRELFYWATVIATFALGTAVGDMTAVTLHLGFFWSGVFFSFVIAIPAIGYRYFNLNEVVAFWFAYIVTRPLGASFADWLGVPKSLGGLGLGRLNVSLGLTLLIVAFVAYLSVSKLDAPVSVAADPGLDPAAQPSG